MAIQKNWDNSHFSDYLLYGSWPPAIAWALLAGFDWYENLDEEPEFIPFYNKDEKEYEEEYRLYKEEVREYYKRKENFRRLQNFWISDELDNDRLAPYFFIDWALSKRFSPDWLDWAIANKLYIPKRGASTESHPIDGLTNEEAFDYVYGEAKADDPINNEKLNYPQELAAALQAWQAVSSIEGKGKPKARIKAWLDNHETFKKLSIEAKERIATVANWDKLGGATRTD